MKVQAVFIAATWLTALTGGAAETVDFDHSPVGGPPAGWTTAQTGAGQPKWEVVADATAPSRPNVLKQSGQAKFALCLKGEPRLQDGFVAVSFKPVAGKEDQAGGLIWRCQDADNYYVARANALEDNVTIYHTIAGRRVAFKNADVKVASGRWHTLRVDFTGPRFTVTFDGKKVLEASDESFKDAGKVGLWTKSDSVTLFDDFRCGGK